MATPWTAQFHIVNGVAQEKSSSIGVFKNSGPTKKSFLYTIADAFNTKDPEPITGEVVGNIEVEFKRGGPSVTAALTSAINSTNNQLVKMNAGKDRDETPRAGISCAALTGSELYIAQAGPSLAYIYSDEKIRRVTPSSTKGGVIDIDDAVGASGNIHINLQRHEMQDGDIVLLASPSLASLISNDELAIILTAEPDQAIQRVFLVAKKVESFSAVLLTLV